MKYSVSRTKEGSFQLHQIPISKISTDKSAVWPFDKHAWDNFIGDNTHTLG